MKKFLSLFLAVTLIAFCCLCGGCTNDKGDLATDEQLEAFFADKQGLADVVTYKIKGKSDYGVQKSKYSGYCVCYEGARFATKYKSRLFALPSPTTGMSLFEIMKEKGVAVCEDGSYNKYVDLKRFNFIAMASKKYKLAQPVVFQAIDVQYYLTHYILAIRQKGWTSLPDAQGEVSYEVYIKGESCTLVATDVANGEVAAVRAITVTYKNGEFKSLSYKHDGIAYRIDEEIEIKVCKEKRIELPDNPDEYKGTITDAQ